MRSLTPNPFVLSAVEAREASDVAWSTSFDCAQDERSVRV